MRYISTRGQAPELGFGDVVLSGLARDGGLYLPAHWPQISAEQRASWTTLSYAELATQVLSHFVGDDIPVDDLRKICHDAYGQFTHPAVAPFVQLEDKLWLMEQFHGPTLAFKDFALQVLGRLFDYLLGQRQQRQTIVGATSGDTGSAAIEAVRGLSHVDLFMLHPAGRVSEVQRRQMTTVTDANIHNIAIDGDFDDCQNLVKTLFNDLAFRDQYRLGAVNSINWARVAAQVVYYFHAARTLRPDGGEVAFSVPSGNFGNVFAGYVARAMGLPVQQFVVGANHNDILTRFFATGAMTGNAVQPSISPSMDIQVSSNFERLLFEVTGRDAQAVTQAMEQFRTHGQFAVSEAEHAQVGEYFASARFSDDETLAQMRRVYAQTGYVLDPHSAIGVAAARSVRSRSDIPMISLATAHPAKFPQAVKRAIGIDAPLPQRCAHILSAPEHCQSLSADAQALKALIADTLGR